MSKVKEKYCRLCLRMLDDDYNVVDAITRGISEVLLLKVDFSVSQEPLLCKSCLKSIREAFDFKSICIFVDKQVISLAIDRNCAELDIRDVYLNENGNKSLIFHMNHNVCRFCLHCQEKSNFNLLNDIRKESNDEMLLKCIPELDLNIVKKPMVCTACMESLKAYYNFAMKCQNTEENIMRYREVQGAECNGQISLSNVLKFMFKGKVKGADSCSKIAVLKEKYNFFQNEIATYSNINNIVTKIEEEELIIRDENKYENYKTEENRCGKTRRKEIVKYDMLTYKNSSGIVMYRCEICTFETKRKHCLRRHMLIHKDNSEVIMYKCNLCNYESKRKDKLKTHMLTHKNSSDVVMYRCRRCVFETKHRRSLKSHMVTYEGSFSYNSDGTMYKCDLCSYESKRKHNLKIHMLTHKNLTDVLMYKCGTCKFQTKHKTSLKMHVLTHKDNSDNSEVTEQVYLM